jgi:pyruvate dehydrogenase E1 component alpha subunit
MSVERRPPHVAAIEREHAHELLRQMLLIRHFEEKSAELYGAGRIRGFLHLYIGEEAIAVGAMQALAPDDAIVATYREHGQALARGIPAGAVMAEMYGKANGCSRGRGGSMHMFDVSRRFYGGHAIVGGGLPFAVGLALADKMQGRHHVTACFFGEGAVAEGEFHESLNLAALWKLPVLFLCENNLYAMGTALGRSESETDLHLKAQAYHVQSEWVDGMDVYAVETAVARAAEAVRRGEGPYFLELRTYRYRAHSMADPDLYRTKEEIAEWRKRDPIANFSMRLKGDGMLTDAELEALEKSVWHDIDWAIDEAERGPLEPVEDLERDVHTPRGAP